MGDVFSAPHGEERVTGVRPETGAPRRHGVNNDVRVIVALDFPDAASALALADRLDPSLCRVKVGKELFTAEGPALVRCAWSIADSACSWISSSTTFPTQSRGMPCGR